jgi:hypothetical protein
MGTSDKPTGLWFEELATPYYAFLDTRVSVWTCPEKVESECFFRL